MIANADGSTHTHTMLRAASGLVVAAVTRSFIFVEQWNKTDVTKKPTTLGSMDVKEFDSMYRGELIELA